METWLDLNILLPNVNTTMADCSVMNKLALYKKEIKTVKDTL